MWERSPIYGICSNGANAFNSDLGGWDVSKVIHLGYIFQNATAFDQSIGSWTLASGVEINNIMSGSGISCENYSKTLIGWARNPETPNNINFYPYD
jgi:hypothetical protein